MFIAHHQEVLTVYVQQLVRVIRLRVRIEPSCILSRPAASHLPVTRIAGLKRDGPCAETDFVFQRKGPVHSNRRGCQLSQAVAGEVCTS
jgi:hypothetical protein